MTHDSSHPEAYCGRCSHRMRFNYSAESDIWNKVVGDQWSIICIDCFIYLCQRVNIEPKFTYFHIPGSEFHYDFNCTLVQALINPDSEFDCLFCKTRFRIGDGHQCIQDEAEKIAEMQEQIDSSYFGSASHKEYLQKVLNSVEKKPRNDTRMLISAVLYGYSRQDIEGCGRELKLTKKRDGYYFTDCTFGEIKLFEKED